MSTIEKSPGDAESGPESKPDWQGTFKGLRAIYEWVEETHVTPTRLIAWTAFVSIAAFIYQLSPVLSALFLMFSIIRVKRAGDALDAFCRTTFKSVWFSILMIIMPITYGFYFLIAMKPLEINLSGIDMRPINPGVADVVNFVGGLLVGLVVMIRYGRKKQSS